MAQAVGLAWQRRSDGSPVNAAEIVKQWGDVHGLAAIPSREEIVDGYSRRVWKNAAGEDVLEQYVISGMGHGTPVAVRSGHERHGAAGPFRSTPASRPVTIL